ncbi:L,D-transpeptidase family protein [Defluviimonas sp. WL0002]|uniref:L,D-transpeptidase family protein n=1 Tax=Albidovulum marisflavi TaxID=2984159 RepID=A0ABT2Z8C2_9RHOB|nr:L,D-transpeptidase family protein [Defluviimonas sp. WL0002]MCV2867388.1 L,D-transpeptidase family protein [Defluviimonas sp. WL0002]
MKPIGAGLAIVAAMMLSACEKSKFRKYDGPEVTQILVLKEKRTMYLLNGERPLKKYAVALGGNPVGDKKVEGDMKTPEGAYHVDRRNPNSAYHLSLGISYPNEQDLVEAKALGKPPGGDIFIHGRAGKNRGTNPDWTAGCIALTDDEIEEVYSMVRTGTPIYIAP